jgi:hypothetical protein
MKEKKFQELSSKVFGGSCDAGGGDGRHFLSPVALWMLR